MSKKEISNLSTAMSEAVETASVYTVMVNARRRFPATGIAISKDMVLTANHVLEHDEDIQVGLPDGTTLSATVAGRDPGSDLALIKLAEEQGSPMIQSDETKVGQLVMALGRPSLNGIQASLGIISAKGGKVRTRHGGFLSKHMRTDATPYPGFSGGPLIDTQGKVIGINTSGLGFSSSVVIPIEIASKVADSLEKHGSVKRGYLGIRSQVIDLPNKVKIDRDQEFGLLVSNVEDDSPADAAGLIVGDILIGFNGQKIENHETLFAVMSGEVVGQATPLEFLRGGKQKVEDVTLTERKTSPHKRGHGGKRKFWAMHERRHNRGWMRQKMARKMRHKMQRHMSHLHDDFHHADHAQEEDKEE